MSTYFITSSGTGIGKTLVTTALAWQLRRAGQAVDALKPVISGYIEGEENDATQIMQSLEREITPENMARISPWRFTAPLSPDMAARRENRAIDLDTLVAFCHGNENKTLLVEGAGGVMAPLNDRYTTLDWIAALECPAILVVGSYLGALSHTLSAAECLRKRNVEIAALVVSESEQSSVPPEETLATLERFLLDSVKTAIIPRLPQMQEMWKHAPDLTGLIA